MTAREQWKRAWQRTRILPACQLINMPYGTKAFLLRVGRGQPDELYLNRIRRKGNSFYAAWVRKKAAKRRAEAKRAIP